ncbi:flagellar filament capping protein FliD [Lactobacillus ruminis]|nr:flagellar filament capping protein FliD [Ligilactobacillus ruminis]MSB53392.1 flagellar filament capping protein FliD [Ligilactobacillus ruminis]MSB55361.1 flagellar filament capping protein FliD [Ligilactobacillus ruminis]MSB80401.1 flagellar filament capping protein FliD [Ligilactobacillus ruminis]MSB90074.1 flagellar filament capping protein FliD [Ligilactobacillus ruminis]
MGQYTGITSDTIDQLLQSDELRKTVIQNKIDKINTKSQAWTDISTRLSNLTSKLDALQDEATYQTKKVASSDDTIATISGTSDSLEGSYDLVVKQLATASKITGGVVSKADGTTKISTKDALGYSGKLTITNGATDGSDTALTVEIDVKATDSLKDIANAINNAKDPSDSTGTKGAGLKATIVNNQLVVSSEEMGDRTLTIGGDLKDSLGFRDSQTTKGQSAKFTLDGIEMERNSNTPTDVVDGVTLNFKKADASKTITLGLTNDTDKELSAVKDFVSQYNSVMSFLSEKMDVGDPSKSGNTTGALAGDSTLISLQSKLQSTVLGGKSVNGVSASTLGLSVDRNGTLSLDETKFKAQLAKNPNAVKDFFFVDTSTKYAAEKTGTGYTADFKAVIDRYTSTKSGSEGVISLRKASYQSEIKDYNKQIERITEQIATKRARYVTMFTNLDTAIGNLQSQFSYFQSQNSSSNS